MPKIQNMGASTPTLVAHPTRDALAADAVTRILDIIEHVLSERTIAHISLTGGTMGIATLKAWAENERVKDIDWSRVHFWSLMSVSCPSVAPNVMTVRLLRRYSLPCCRTAWLWAMYTAWVHPIFSPAWKLQLSTTPLRCATTPVLHRL